jgi:hypothetical protein
VECAHVSEEFDLWFMIETSIEFFAFSFCSAQLQFFFLSRKLHVLERENEKARKNTKKNAQERKRSQETK